MILAELSHEDSLLATRHAQEVSDQAEFLAGFESTCSQEIRPAMESVLKRLELNGGGGLIESHPGGEARVSTPRLTLWMSLKGPIVGEARPDLHPYLQLDAEVLGREVRITQGDMWHGRGGGHSGVMGAWKLPEITRSRVVHQLIEILRQSAPTPTTD